LGIHLIDRKLPRSLIESRNIGCRACEACCCTHFDFTSQS
jgi:hypothetical protein